MDADTYVVAYNPNRARQSAVPTAFAFGPDGDLYLGTNSSFWDSSNAGVLVYQIPWNGSSWDAIDAVGDRDNFLIGQDPLPTGTSWMSVTDLEIGEDNRLMVQLAGDEAAYNEEYDSMCIRWVDFDPEDLSVTPTSEEKVVSLDGEVIDCSGMWGVHVADDGRMFFAGGPNRDLVALNPDGSMAWSQYYRRDAGYDSLHLRNVRDLTLDSQNRLWVVDQARSQLLCFDAATGKLLDTYGNSRGIGMCAGPDNADPYAFNDITGIEAVTTASGVEWLYVADVGNQQLHRFKIGGVHASRGVVTNVSTDSWLTVELPQSFCSMVVVATPVYASGQVPLVTRIQNASGNSFEIKVQRVDGIATGVNDVTVEYLVVEEGVYTEAADGITMEAVKCTSTVTDSANSWVGESRSYANSYTSPVVLGQVMTTNDADWSTFWSYGATVADPAAAAELHIGKHVGEDTDTTRADETIGYIVIEAGSGTLAGHPFVAAVGADSVTGDYGTYDLSSHNLGSVAGAVASQAAMDDADGSWVVLDSANPPTTTQLTLTAEEDKVGDAEQSHASEQVSYLIFEWPVGAVAYDGFESGDNTGGSGFCGNWSLNAQAGIYSQAAYAGSHSLRVVGDGVSPGEATRTVDLSGVTVARMEFSWSVSGFEAGDQAVLEVYDGSTWETLMVFDDALSDDQWRSASVEIPFKHLISGVQVRFRSLADAVDDVLMIDELWIVDMS